MGTDMQSFDRLIQQTSASDRRSLVVSRRKVASQKGVGRPSDISLPEKNSHLPSATAALVLVLCVGLWYVAGALTNSTSKQALKASANPFWLTFMQHLAAAVCGRIAFRGMQIRPYKPLELSALPSIASLVTVYSVGFILTNASFGAVNASFVDTVKAGEPIFTVLLSFLLLRQTTSISVLLSLLPVVVGVSVSSMSEASFNILGFALAMSSNCCFSARSVLSKLALKHPTLKGKMDNANLFVHVNVIGAMLLLPLALAFEGFSALLSILADQSALRLFLANGVLYYLNNQMNFVVLEQVDTVTHGLINCGRRVANISFAIVWFSTPVNVFNGIGIFLALLGAFLFAHAKGKEGQAKSAANARIASPGKRSKKMLTALWRKTASLSSQCF